MTTTTLFPLTKQKFFDGNGTPLAFGIVTTYAAGTNTPLATYIDSTGNTPNANPLTLNARGEADIWVPPNVAYKLALTDSLGNTIPGWPIDNIVNSQLVSLYGGVDTGVANAYILNFTSPVPPNTSGQVIYWLPANSNTGPSTINVNGSGPQPIVNPNGSSLGANQILSNQFVSIISINGVWQLYGGSGVGVNVGTFGTEFAITSATTTDLGSAPGHNVAITGTTTITSFGASAQTIAPIYIGRFTNSLTLTNSASLILPGGNNIVTTSGDSFIAEYMGSGNWRVLIYQYASATSTTFSVKAADTSRQSTVALANDPDLQLNLLTGQYDYELFMLFDSVAGGAGFKFQSDGTAVDSRGTSPAVATGLVNAAAYGPKLESFVGATVSYATVGTTSDSNGVLYKGSLLITTAGTFGVQWAQVSSTASNTTLRAGSYLTCTLLAQKTATSGVQHFFSSPGTSNETIPAGMTTMVIEGWGAGGKGGFSFQSGANISGGGGGGGGAYFRHSLNVSGHSGQTIQVTVGAGSGGLTQIVSGTFTIATLTANGGSNGGNAPNLATGGTGGAGGTASGANLINQTGNAGGAGVNNAGGGTGGDGGGAIPGLYGAAGGGSGGALIPANGLDGEVIFTYSP